MGLVSLTMKKSESDMRAQQEQFKAQLHQIFGNKPNITVNIDSFEPLSDAKCQVVIYVQEKSQVSNEIKRIASTEVNNFLNQPMTKTQLTQSGVEEVIPLISPDEDQLKEYLDKPPKGIDPRMWNQAKHDNPDPKVFIPVPIIGFAELKRRIKCQEKETEMHSLYIAKVRKDLEEMKQKHIDGMAKISAHKRKLADLSHNILDVSSQFYFHKISNIFFSHNNFLNLNIENSFTDHRKTRNYTKSWRGIVARRREAAQ